MFQNNNNGKAPGKGMQDVKKAGSQFALDSVQKAAAPVIEKLGENVKEKKEKVEKGVQTGQQIVGAAQQIGAATKSLKSASTKTKPGVTSGINGNAGMDNANNNSEAAASQSPKKASNAAAIAASQVLGVSHLTLLKIVVDGTIIKNYSRFYLSQSAIHHHQFYLTLAHDSLGSPEDHQLENAQKLLGKKILVTFTFKNITGGPERDFIGIITEVGFSRENGNHGNIVLSGNSPTVLLDAAPHIQSFGGASPTSLSDIANSVLKEGLGGSYSFNVDPTFKGNLSYSCQYNESHYNFLARTAEAYGEQFFYDGQTLHFGKLPEGETPINLTFGTDVEQVYVQMKTRHVNRTYYGYNSKTDERLTTGETKITLQSSLAKSAYDISGGTFTTPSLKIAPIKAATNKDVEAAQTSTSGSIAVDVFTTTGRTSVPFLYPGCIIEMNMRKAGNIESSYFTQLMVTEIVHDVDAIGNYTGRFEAIGAGSGYMPMPAHYMPVAEPQMAIVKSNDDSQGRVQVQFAWQPDGTTTEFIRVMSPDAGGSDKVSSNRGLVTIPEVKDQVLIGFVHNHPDRPFVFGGLFAGKIGGGGGASNNIKSLTSKSGHTVQLDDGGGMTIKDKTGGNHIVVDGTNKVTVTASQTVELTNGQASITLENDKITIYASEIEIAKKGGPSAKIEIKGKDVSVFGQTELKLNSDASIKAESKGACSIKATGAMGVEGANTEIKASAITTVKGATVKLN